jgi:hypothetical protein
MPAQPQPGQRRDSQAGARPPPHHVQGAVGCLANRRLSHLADLLGSLPAEFFIKPLGLQKLLFGTANRLGSRANPGKVAARGIAGRALGGCFLGIHGVYLTCQTYLVLGRMQEPYPGWIGMLELYRSQSFLNPSYGGLSLGTDISTDSFAGWTAVSMS